MYHIALFTFHADLLAGKLEAFLASDWRGVERIDTTASGAAAKSRAVSGPADLPPRADAAAPGYWSVFQRQAGIEHPLPDHARYQHLAHNSLDELDTFLSELARRHLWAVIPWGGPAGDDAFAFVAAEGWRLERFLAKSPNATPVPWYSPGGSSFRIVPTELLLARHAVIRSILDRSTVALTAGAGGGAFWGASVSEGEAVWLAAPPLVSEGPEQGAPETQVPADDVEAMGSVREDIGDAEEPLWLYRVSRREAFIRMAERAPVSVLSGELSRERAVELLREFLDDRNPQCVARVARLISRAPWFYTSGESEDSRAYARFGSRRNELLARYVASTDAGGLELIGLF